MGKILGLIGDIAVFDINKNIFRSRISIEDFSVSILIINNKPKKGKYEILESYENFNMNESNLMHLSAIENSKHKSTVLKINDNKEFTVLGFLWLYFNMKKLYYMYDIPSKVNVMLETGGIQRVVFSDKFHVKKVKSNVLEFL